MEENSNENAFIIQTIDITNTNSDDFSKECVLNEAPILLSTSQLNSASKYITCYENGEIVLKELDDSMIKTSINNEIVSVAKNEEDKSSVKLNACSAGVKINAQELRKLQEKQTLKVRKKLCYEKPYNLQPFAMQSKHDAQGVLRRPRKQLIDHKTMISPREFKCQLNYTADTITTTKLAPCTRQQLVHVLNGITTLFAHPAHKMPNANLMQLYVSRCTCKKEPNMMSTDDMNLLPLIENISKSSSNNANPPPLKRIYGKRKNNAALSMATMKKMQIIENTKEPAESNINLSSINKIYRNRKCNKDPLADNDIETIQSKYISENIDHKYSKKIANEPQLDKIDIDEGKFDENQIYTITLDLNNIKEEHITENQIVILSVDNDGELTENNISVLLDAANNIKTDDDDDDDLPKDSENEVVALTRNECNEDFNNTISNIFVVRPNNDNAESEQILGDITDLTTS